MVTLLKVLGLLIAAGAGLLSAVTKTKRGSEATGERLTGWGWLLVVAIIIGGAVAVWAQLQDDDENDKYKRGVIAQMKNLLDEGNRQSQATDKSLVATSSASS
jgi:uncharacterized protein HemX